MKTIRRSPFLLLLALSVVVWGCSGGGSSPTAPGLSEAPSDSASADARKQKDSGSFVVTFSGTYDTDKTWQGSGSGFSESKVVHIHGFDVGIRSFFASLADPNFEECFGGSGYNGELSISADRKDPGKWTITWDFGGHQIDGVTVVGYKLTLTADGTGWPVLQAESEQGSGGTWDLRGFKRQRTCQGSGNLAFTVTVDRPVS